MFLKKIQARAGAKRRIVECRYKYSRYVEPKWHLYWKGPGLLKGERAPTGSRDMYINTDIIYIHILHSWTVYLNPHFSLGASTTFVRFLVLVQPPKAAPFYCTQCFSPNTGPTCIGKYTTILYNFTKLIDIWDCHYLHKPDKEQHEQKQHEQGATFTQSPARWRFRRVSRKEKWQSRDAAGTVPVETLTKAGKRTWNDVNSSQRKKLDMDKRYWPCYILLDDALCHWKDIRTEHFWGKN